MVDRVPYLDIKRAHRPIIKELENALDDVLDQGQLVLGKNLESFEKNYAIFSQTKLCLGVANGLDALILSLLALGIGEGDEVLAPSNTYIATLFAITRAGGVPALVEPDRQTYNIDPSKIEERLTKKTKVIMPVHLFGQISEMGKIMTLAKKYNLFVIEDNAQSHGSEFNGRIAGSFGHINATSFYPGKNLGALGDGGAITTDDAKHYEMIKILRNYGSREKYYNDVIGYNSRLDELQAAFLNIKLKKLKEKNRIRQELAKKYIHQLSGIGDLVMPKTAGNCSHVYHAFVIRTKKRDQLRKHLESNKISTVIHYPIPPHLQKAYAQLGLKKGDFPIAEELASTSLSIPVFPEMTEEEQEYVIEKVKLFYAS